MKFAIPMAEGKLTAHFGHCQEFALIVSLRTILYFLTQTYSDCFVKKI